MPNLMTRGATWLAANLQAAGGSTVTYEPGNGAAVSVSAVLRDTDRTVTGEEGFETSVAPFTWLIPAADLPGVTPRQGHKIKRYGANGWEIYSVLQPSEAEQAANIDPTGTIWTIHTKRVQERDG